MSIENGETPAMPHDRGGYTGLTKRELFAAMAMQGLLAIDADWIPDCVATKAARCADALLAELAKKGGGE